MAGKCVDLAARLSMNSKMSNLKFLLKALKKLFYVSLRAFFIASLATAINVDLFETHCRLISI